MENLNIVIDSIKSLFGSGDEANNPNAQIAPQPSDPFGFDKTLVFMTKPNKAVAISSLKGNLLWSRLIKDPVRRMVLEQAGGDASIDLVTSTSIVKIDPKTGAIRKTEALPSLPQKSEDTEFLIAQGHLKGDEKAPR